MAVRIVIDSTTDLPAEALQPTLVGSVIGTHAGPGAIAAAFFKK